MKVFQYHKTLLNEKEKSLYDKMYRELRNFNFNFTVKDFDANTCNKVFEYLYFDHPEIYYVSPTNGDFIEYDVDGKTETEVHLSDLYPSKELKDKIIAAFDAAVRRIKGILPKNPTELDIEVAVIKYIFKICEPTIDDSLNQNAASVLAFKKAQCTGYSKAIALLLNKFNIDCVSVFGEAIAEDFSYQPHAWNIVKLFGEYYQLDLVYGIQYIKDKSKVNLELFNCTDKKICRTHKMNMTYPKCSDEKFEKSKCKFKIDNKPFESIKLD